MSPPALKAVLIGRVDGGVGLTARLVEFSDQRAGPGKQTLERSVSNQLDKWCTAHHGAFPSDPDEVIIKLARHRDGDNVWTWLGVYRAAAFTSDRRRNTYVGAGLLACNANPPVVTGLPYLGLLVANMPDEGGVVRQSAQEFADRLGQNPLELRPERLTLTGLSPDSAARLYLNLGEVTGAALEAAAAKYLTAALTQPGFGHGWELTLGNSQRLAQLVRGSADFMIYSQTSPPVAPPPPPDPAPARGDPRAVASSGGHPGASGVWPASGSQDRSMEMEALRLKVDRLERLVRGEDGGRGVPSFSSSGLFLTAIVGLLMAIALLVAVPASRILFDLLGEKEAPPTLAEMDEAVTDPLIELDPATGCVVADLTDDSPEGRERLDEELNCRQQEAIERDRRISELESARSRR